MPLWTPALISTSLWLDGSDSSTLFDAVSGGSAVAANGTIGRWQDKSGNARHVTQSTSGKRPTRRTAVINGRDIVRFDGTDDQLTSTSGLLRNVAGWSVFFVGVSTTSTTQRSVLHVLNSFTSSRVFVGKTITNGFATAGGRRLAANSYASTTGSTNINGTSLWSVVGSFTDTILSGWTNGTSFGVNSSWLTSGNTENDAGEVSIGGLYAGADYWDGDFAELIVIESAVDTDTRQNVEGYLAWGWGTVDLLEVDHPYKTYAPGDEPTSSKRRRRILKTSKRNGAF